MIIKGLGFSHDDKFLISGSPDYKVEYLTLNKKNYYLIFFIVLLICIFFKINWIYIYDHILSLKIYNLTFFILCLNFLGIMANY